MHVRIIENPNYGIQVRQDGNDKTMCDSYVHILCEAGTISQDYNGPARDSARDGSRQGENNTIKANIPSLSLPGVSHRRHIPLQIPESR